MTCSEYRDRLEELLDGLLPPEEAGRFDSHASECAECAERAQDAAAFSELLESSGRQAMSDWVAERLVNQATADAGSASEPASAASKPEVATPRRAEPTPLEAKPRPARATPQKSASSAPVRVPVRRPSARRPLAASEAAVTQEIQPQGLLPRTRFQTPGQSRFQTLRLVAAAIVVAAVGFFSADLLSGSDMQALAAGTETRIESGQNASVGEGRWLSAEGRAVVVTLVPGSGGAELQIARGVGLFHVDPGQPLAVHTPAGVARGVGASFLVDVRGDGAVAVSGVTGRVHFEHEGTRTTLRTGERIEVDRRGRVRLVNGARIDRLEVERALWESEFQRLRDRLDVAEEQLVAYGAAVAPESADQGSLPYDELGRAMRTLFDSKLSYKDAARMKAMAVFLANADRIQSEFGASDPMRAMKDPRFMEAISESFLRALAPNASEIAIASAAAEWHRATDDVLLVMKAEPLPAQLAVARERSFTQVIRSIERHVGVDAAAEVVRGASFWRELRPYAETLDERVESRFVAYWQKRFDMDEAQSGQLVILVRNYIAETVRAQGVIAATLPPNQIESALFPRWRRRGWGEDRRRSPSADRQPEPADSEVVTAKLRQMEARIALAEPRIRFESGLWDLLRSDQRENGFGWGARVHSFREAKGN